MTPDLLLSIPLTDSVEAEGFVQPVAESGVESDADGSSFEEDSFLVFPDSGNATGEAGTISFEMEPFWYGNDAQDNHIVSLSSPHQSASLIEIWKNRKGLRFDVRDNAAEGTNITAPIESWVPGECHSVTVTWDGNTTALYVDGQLIDRKPYSGELDFPPGTPLYVGGSNRPGSGAGARMRDFKLYGRAFTDDEVMLGPPVAE